MAKRERSSRSFGRKPSKRYRPNKVVILVCEDSKSSPKYFEALKKDLKLKNINVQVYGEECDSAPISVINYAIKLEKDLRKEVEIEKIFCVIDRDEHETFVDACNKVRMNEKIDVISSDPCFEVWLIQHFKLYKRAIIRVGNSSPGKETVNELKKDISDYSKSDGKVAYDKTKHLLEKVALPNVIKLREHLESTGSINPQTDIDILINFLIALKNERKGDKSLNL